MDQFYGISDIFGVEDLKRLANLELPHKGSVMLAMGVSVKTVYEVIGSLVLKGYTLVDGRLISDIMMSKLDRGIYGIDKLSKATYFLEVAIIDDAHKVLGKLGYSVFCT